MSCTTIQDSRFTIKYSTISGQEPTIPLSDDHTDGTWLPTDLYIGEFFMNSSDDKLWIRTDNGIVPLGGTSGSTYSFIGDYVHISGGTYSGTVYAPTFSANGITASYIISDLFEGNFNGTFTGDGSGLTGINANWLGGTVSNPVFFTNEVTLDNTTYINGPITTTNSCVEFDTSICVTGGVSASYFIGDGSGLTNIPLGTYSDVYTTDAQLSGNSIIFTRNDSFTYDVDLTPILASQSIAFINWNEITNTISITLTDGQVISETIDTFTGITSLGPINGTEFYGGNFYGTFVGTYSNDIYTTGATLSGTELIFDRTDGASYSVDLSPIVGGGGATPSLSQVLTEGNITGTNWINSTQNYGIRNNSNTSNYLQFDSTGNTLQSVNISSPGEVTTISTQYDGSHIQNVLQTTDGLDTTKIVQRHYEIVVSGSASFPGIQYLSDYSTNYTNRSLVDKEYVDSLVGATPSLSEVLIQGNNTNNNDIVLNTNPLSSTADNIRAFGNTLDDSKFSFEDLGSNEWAPTMRVDDADTQNYITVGKTDTYIHSSQVGGAINRYSQVKLNNGASSNVEMSSQNLANGEYSLIRTRVDGNVVLENHEGVRIEFYPQLLSTDPKNIIITAPDEFILQGGDMKIIGATGGFAGIKYNADYSANYTNRSLVDKEYVDSVAGAGGTLEQTLALGNSTGTHSIIIGSASPGPTGTKIRTASGENSIYFAEAPFVSSTYIRNSVVDGYAYLQVSREDGVFSESVDDNTGNDAAFVVQAGNSTTPVITGTINDYGNNQTTSFNIQSEKIRVVGENLAFAPTIFQGIVYENDYSENYTNRSLVDKAYVDNAISAGGGTSSFIPEVSGSEIFRGQTHRNNSTTIDTYGGIVTSTSASTQAQSVATTGFRHRSIKLRYYASVVSTGRYTGVRGSAQQFWSITGGFRYVCDFAISDAANSSNTQTFMGLAAQNTDLGYATGTTEVSTLTNLIGVGNDSTDTNLQIIHNDASGTSTKIDLGVNFPCQRTTTDITAIYSVVIYNECGSSEVKVEVTNKETGDVTQHTLTTNLPANTSLLNFFASRGMGTPVTNTGEFYLYKLGVYHLV